MKLFVLLLIFTCVAWQQSDAYKWMPRPGVIGLPRPGVIGMSRPGPFGRYGLIVSKRAERDLGTELDTDEDGYLDETELEQHLSERDILDFISALNENGDDLLSVDEFNDKQ
ncbi:uncharacterized protein LOC121370739 [Gigantopelta aegis]|uniref:uncharacterized protein LOC121370739 n=1 Tax=Gigantopelta aegis TaxID=1735272 RepID=UPI001B88C8AD|nr:uncharacterized protein LOC121370739 [Gigantopelta aegis]